MASTINLPGLGPTGKGKVYGIAIGGVAVAGFLIYKRNATNKKQAAATAAAQAQAANAYGYGQAAYGYGGSQGGYYGYGASGGFNATGYYGYGTPYPSGPTGGVAATTNAQWEQAAITQLTGEGYDAKTVSAALGAYTMGQQVTSDQQAIIQSAIGLEGYPPDPGKNGFPPSINVTGTPGGGTGGGQTPPPSPKPPTPVPPPAPAQLPQHQYKVIVPWPGNPSTWWQVSQMTGVSVDSLYSLNPTLASRPPTGGAPTLYAGDHVFYN